MRGEFRYEKTGAGWNVFHRGGDTESFGYVVARRGKNVTWNGYRQHTLVCPHSASREQASYCLADVERTEGL